MGHFRVTHSEKLYICSRSPEDTSYRITGDLVYQSEWIGKECRVLLNGQI